MADHLFSAARLRGYRILEHAGLGGVEDLVVRNTLIGSHLWLPVSLIEVAFRNLADEAVTRAHPRRGDWLLDSGGSAGLLAAVDVRGPHWLHSQRDDGSTEDPVRIAARMSSAQTQRTEVTRDDIVAHLMLGFWVVRVPEALEGQIDVFGLVAADLPAPMDSGERLKRAMVNDILRIRNRLAHHEPLMFRRKHVISRKSGQAKEGLDLVSSLQGAITSFRREASEVVAVAGAMVPAASPHLQRVMDQLDEDVTSLSAELGAARTRLEAARDERRAERRQSPQ